MSLKISISGVRGVYPQEINEDVAYELARAFCELIPAGSVVVSRDTRKSGKALSEAVKRAIKDSGRNIIDIGITPLPTTAMAVPHFKAVGGIDVTASHNPAEYNGLKFLNNKGQFISAKQAKILSETLSNKGNRIEKRQVKSNKRKSKKLSIANRQKEACDFHISQCLKWARAGKKLAVAVDATNSSGSVIVPQLLRKMGCCVIPIATDIKADFPHPPEPKKANLTWTLEKLKKHKFDFAVVVDPDADRLVLINEKGKLLSEELTVSLFVKSILKNTKTDVVVNGSTTNLVDLIANQNGVKVYRSSVGEKNVVEKMIETGSLVGGEGSGGVIDGRIHYGRDALVGIVHMVNLLRHTNKTLSAICKELPKFYMIKVNVSLKKKVILKDVEKKLKEKIKGKVTMSDGIKIENKDGWIQVRFSNTEPIVRIIAESRSKVVSERMIKQAKKILG